MKPKFKVGDKIKCIDNDLASGVTIGNIYTVLEKDYAGDVYLINDRNHRSVYLAKRFEKVTVVPTPVVIDGKSYDLDVSRAKELGILKDTFVVKDGPLQAWDRFVMAGDVRSHNPVILVRTKWVDYKYKWEDARMWQLVNTDTSAGINSNKFFEEEHTMKEIQEYLEQNKLQYINNIA